MTLLSSVTNISAMSAQRYLGINTSNATRAAQALSSGSRVSNPAYDPASAAIGSSLRATIAKLNQATKNATQATALLQLGTGVLDSSNRVLEKMATLAAQASSDTVGAGERGMLQQEFSKLRDQLTLNVNSAVWGGVKLFNGGAGTATAATNNANAALSGFGTPALANTINNATASNMTGFISGTVTDAKAKRVGPDMYELTVQVGAQTFTATSHINGAAALINFEGTTDRANKFSIPLQGNGSAITTDAIFTTALREYFQLNATAAASKFLSASVAAPAEWAVTAGAGTEGGIYSISYQEVAAGGTGYFKLTNGKYMDMVEVTTSAAMTQTVTFGNGLSLALTAFDGTAAFTGQVIYNVTAGTGASMSFQVGENSSDTVAVNFTPAGASALGIASVDISTKSGASSALNTIALAQDTLNNAVASLGAASSQLTFTLDNLQVASQNQEAARATFVDADVGEELRKATQSRSLADIASTTLTQALADTQRLARMVQQAG